MQECKNPIKLRCRYMSMTTSPQNSSRPIIKYEHTLRLGGNPTHTQWSFFTRNNLGNITLPAFLVEFFSSRYLRKKTPLFQPHLPEKMRHKKDEIYLILSIYDPQLFSNIRLPKVDIWDTVLHENTKKERNNMNLKNHTSLPPCR